MREHILRPATLDHQFVTQRREIPRPGTEVKASRRFDFFREPDIRRFSQMLDRAKREHRPFTIVAIACPELLTNYGVLPYATDPEDTTTLEKYSHSSQDTQEKADVINAVTQFAHRHDVPTSVILMVSNIEPILFRMATEYESTKNLLRLFAEQNSPELIPFLTVTLKSKNMITPLEEINERILESAQAVASLIQADRVLIKNHLHELFMALTRNTSGQADELAQANQLLNHINAYADLSNRTDLLRELYTLDISLLPSGLLPRSEPGVWLNLQVTDHGQTKLIADAVDAVESWGLPLPLPIIRSISSG